MVATNSVPLEKLEVLFLIVEDEDGTNDEASCFWGRKWIQQLL